MSSAIVSTAPPPCLPDTPQTRAALFISPSVTIHKHEWCCVVYRHPTYGACTDYHWRKHGSFAQPWRSEQDWPRYDTNDTHNGLPIGVRKLWERHRAQIDAALAAGKGGAP